MMLAHGRASHGFLSSCAAWERQTAPLGHSGPWAVAHLVCLLLHVLGDVGDFELGAERFVIPHDRLHLHEVDDAREVRFGACVGGRDSLAEAATSAGSRTCREGLGEPSG